VQSGRAQAREKGDAFYINVERIEKQPAVGRIRTRLVRLIIKQRMQRVDSNRGSAPRRRDLKQLIEIGEVAVAPVARRPYAIKLDRKPPHALEAACKCCRRSRSRQGQADGAGLRIW
jgi:hypothetical protein